MLLQGRITSSMDPEDEKMDQSDGAIWQVLSQRERGLKVIHHSLILSHVLLLLPLLFYDLLFFFFSLSFLLVASSFVSPMSSMVASEICTWWYRLFSWCFILFHDIFRILSSFSFLFFFLLFLFFGEARATPTWCPCRTTVVIPVVASRCSTLHQWCMRQLRFSNPVA